jgi:mono/diheme cytochrome c family protein
MTKPMRRTWSLAVGVGAAFALAASAGSLAQQTGDTAGTGASTSNATTGEQTYHEICQACHMANAEGGTGAAKIPALAANAHLADANFVLNRVIHGQGGMPAFADMLSAEQIAGVVSYVRTHFGNSYADPVTPNDVKRLSPEAGSN